MDDALAVTGETATPIVEASTLGVTRTATITIGTDGRQAIRLVAHTEIHMVEPQDIIVAAAVSCSASSNGSLDDNGNDTMDTVRMGNDETDLVKRVVNEVALENEIVGLGLSTDLTTVPVWTYKLSIPIYNGSDRTRAMCNGIFHRLGLLPASEVLDIGDVSRYCQIRRCLDFYFILFNGPSVVKEESFDRNIVLQNYRDMGRLQHDERFFLQLKEYDDFNDIEYKEHMEDVLSDIKSGRLRAKCPQDIYVIILQEDFDAIANGHNKVLQYEFTLHDIRCAIGLKTVLVQHGYGTYNTPPRQIMFAVADTRLVDEDGKECDPYNVPDDFWPTAIAVHLGQKINGGEHLKSLKFTAWDKPDSTRFIGCVGSLGKLNRLDGDCISGVYARFILHADSGVYCLDTRAYEPGFQALRFLRVWRKNVQSETVCQALLFNPQIVASIEKAGLSFMNHFGIEEHLAGGEIELLDEQAALAYLRNARDFNVDTWPLECGLLSRILWCDTNFRPLCERRTDFSMAAEFDHGLWSVLSASHPKDGNGEWGDAAHRAFLEQRYGAYAAIRNGVVPRWEDWRSY